MFDSATTNHGYSLDHPRSSYRQNGQAHRREKTGALAVVTDSSLWSDTTAAESQHSLQDPASEAFEAFAAAEEAKKPAEEKKRVR